MPTAEEIENLANSIGDFEAEKRKRQPAICIRCAHFNNGGANPAAPNAWYNFKCAAPAVQAEEAVNPQTGEKGYRGTNDLGGRFWTDDARPYCRDINPESRCPHFTDPDQTDPA